ncbi:MAG TPA: site-2 protease family protein [Candidatus Fimivicinus intestinavium]|nr:site-2 protease family protein [Candidatus Fimivicinus intestinavium]
MVWPILIAILFFGLMIFIHELGHFTVAKLSGIRVNEFAIGMGPKLLSFGKGETTYSLRLIPMGGYVQMEGEDEASEDERAFNKKPVWKRFLVVLAGAVMNILLGLVLVAILITQQDLVGTTQIAGFYENASSQASGLQAGDVITHINGTSVWSDRDISFLMARDKDGVIEFTVERDGKTVDLKNVQFATQQVEGQTVITFDFVIIGEPHTVWNVLKTSFLETASMARLVWLSLFDLVTGRFGLSDLAGPVGTVSVIAEATTSGGFLNALSLMAFITVNIGVFNLLPIPGLDGGRLLFLVIEGIRRKPVNPKREGMIHAIGLVLMFALIAVVTFNDILRLIRGG